MIRVFPAAHNAALNSGLFPIVTAHADLDDGERAALIATVVECPQFAPCFPAWIERTGISGRQTCGPGGPGRRLRGGPWRHSAMERIAQELADLADADLDRIADVIDALTGALPEPLTAWVRHLVDQERDGRAGKNYPLRPPSDALEDDDYPACIAATRRLRDSSIDLPLAALLDAVAEVLEGYQARGVPGVR